MLRTSTLLGQYRHGSASHGTFILMLVLAFCLFFIGMNAKAFAASFTAKSISSSHVASAKQAAQPSGNNFDSASSTAEQAYTQVESSAERAEAILAPIQPVNWRIRILEAATLQHNIVYLGDIAVPAGNAPDKVWAELAALPLWVAPAEGRAASMTRPRLQQAILDSLGRSAASLCLYPASASFQRGGQVITAAEVQELTMRTLSPMLHAMQGETELKDFRLPSYIFLAHQGQTLELDKPARLVPGRLSLRYSVREADGSIARRLTGTVFLNNWVSVPCSTTALNKGQILQPEHITFVRKNMAHLREDAWDGAGGPWRLSRNIGPDQPIFASDVNHIPTVTKGSLMTLVYENKSVRLSVRVEALSDGFAGENIMVRNVHSKKQLYATVHDAGTVVIRKSGYNAGNTSGAAPLSVAANTRRGR